MRERAVIAACALVVLAAGLCGCSDKSTAVNDKPSISITCQSDECVARPDILKSWPKQMVVKGPPEKGAWECKTVSPTDGTAAFIKLYPKGQPDRSLSIAVIEQRRPGMFLPIFSLSLALLGVIAALGMAWLVREDGATRERLAISAEASLRRADRALQGLVETLAFPPFQEPRAAAGAEPAPAPMAREVDTLKAEIGQFVQYVKDCFVSLQNRSEAVEGKVRELERLNMQLGRQTDAATARGQYQSLARTLARLALRATDDDYSHHGARNPSAEAALSSLLKAAGYSLLTPKKLDRYSEGLHISSPRTAQAENRNQRGCIARVERRGLLDTNNDVIEKAEVVLYD